MVREKLVAAVMMQKNEGELLEFWLRYHGRIFGDGNLYVFDNGSDCPRTLEILKNAESRGIQVTWDYRSPLDFENKGKIVWQKASELFQDSYQFVVPLDCDEMLCLVDDEKPLLDRDAILGEFVRSTGYSQYLFRINHTFFNVPGSYDFYHRGIKKLVIKSNNEDLDLGTGFHLYNFQRQQEFLDPSVLRPSRFAVLHFHNKPYELFLKSAREKMKTRVRSFSREDLAGYSGKGSHLVKYFFMSEREFAERLPKTGLIDLEQQFGDLAPLVPYARPGKPPTPASIRKLLDPFNPEPFVEKMVMTRNEVLALCGYLGDAVNYIEYGSGGSTAAACEIGVQNILSVETSLGFISETAEKFGLHACVLGGRLAFRHVDFRQTREWGYPIHPLDEKTVRYYVSFVMEPPFRPDVVLIDGRYRVACALASYLGCDDDAVVLVHDYVSRRHYHVIEEVFDIRQQVDQLVRLQKKPGAEVRARELLQQYLSDPR